MKNYSQQSYKLVRDCGIVDPVYGIFVHFDDSFEDLIMRWFSRIHIRSISTCARVITMTNRINSETGPLLEFHLIVLKELLNGKRFREIENHYVKEFKELNYLQKATKNLLSFHDGELVGAYPVSPKETKYKIMVEDIGDGYAMCAIDALGVAYTFMKKTRIECNFFNSDEIFVFEVDPYLEDQEKRDIFVTYKKFSETVGNAALEQCPMINIFQSEKEIPQNENLEILDFATALRYAKQRFSQDALLHCFRGTFDQVQILNFDK